MFIKGQSGNIKGRPKGSRDFGTELVAALKRAEKRDKESLLDYAVKRARKSDKVLCSLLSKVVPDLSEQYQNGDFDMNIVVMSKSEAIDYHKRKLALYEAQDAVKDGIAEE